MSLRLPLIVCFKYIFLIALVIVNGESSADRISIAKCNEYQTVCPLEASPFNIEGEVAVPKEFPFMALLGYERDNELSWPCAGSLISENFVLTAGHCISSIRSLGRTIQYVRLGDLDFKSENEDAQVRQFNVTESFLHPEYKDRSFYNDIALLKIDRTVDFSDYIRPACLPHQDTEISDRVIVTGWGQTSTSSREQPSTLQKVQLKLVPLGVCNETYSESRRQLQNGLSEETQLCAGSNKGERDTCPGFGGGPLLNTGRKFSCLNEIVGITSFGKGCGSGYPGVYTRIASYVDWIESIVWPVK